MPYIHNLIMKMRGKAKARKEERAELKRIEKDAYEESLSEYEKIEREVRREKAKERGIMRAKAKVGHENYIDFGDSERASNPFESMNSKKITGDLFK